jgi:glycosyltransferase involved in cell wall biosynthesis
VSRQPAEASALDAVRGRAVDVVHRGRMAWVQERKGLLDALGALGLEVSRASQDAVELAPDRIVLLLGNAAWYPLVVAGLRAAPPARRPFVVVWHSEPLPFPARSGLRPERLHARELAKIVLRDSRATDPYSNLRSLLRLSRDGLVDLLAVSTGAAHELLGERGVGAEIVPLGYTATDGRDLGLTRDVDVLLLASLDVPRRRRILRFLRRRGVPVRGLGDWNDPSLWGEERTRLLNRTKILLNVPRHRGLLSGRTMILGMANKALVVAEPIYRPEPYRPGTDFASAELADMPETIEWYLEDDARRAPIVEPAYARVRGELTIERSARRLVSLLDERLRAAGR